MVSTAIERAKRREGGELSVTGADERYIDAYLERIGYTGAREPCPETLVELQRRHLYSIPFENLDILRGVEPNVDRDYLFDKLVLRRRGGVCYELNSSFYYLLCALGFSAYQISGRNRPDLPMTGHVFTLVRLPEGDHIADVGYGDLAVPPVKIGAAPVSAYHATYWLEREEGDLLRLYTAWPGQEPRPQYQFSLTPRTQADYMDTFRYSATPGNTIFSQRHVCCRFGPEGKLSLRKGVFSVERAGRVLESRPLTGEEEIERCLIEKFAIPASAFDH